MESASSSTQNKLGCDVMGGVAQVNSGHAPATMEVAIFAVAQRRGTALRAVGFDVLTAGGHDIRNRSR